MTFFIAAVAAALSYLAGSISAAILVCRLRGLPDPRSTGSGNPGATNVLRTGGKSAAAMTLVGDALKGVIPVVIARLMGLDASVVALVAVAAFLGHLYPVFFNFEGGKGVATALGALLATNITAGLLALLIWLAASLAGRRSSLAALVTFALVPILLLMEAAPVAATAFTLIGVGLFYTHRSNIGRLLNGTEPRIGEKTRTDS